MTKSKNLRGQPRVGNPPRPSAASDHVFSLSARGFKARAIAEKTGRSLKWVELQISLQKADSVICLAEREAFLKADEKHVAAVLAHGGFPIATPDGWIGADGRPWRAAA